MVFSEHIGIQKRYAIVASDTHEVAQENLRKAAPLIILCGCESHFC